MMNNEELINFCGSLIGTPYKSGSMGPDTFDCWGLIRHVEREAFDRDVQAIIPPDDENDLRALVYFIKNHPEHQNWKKVEIPAHGGVVEMSSSTHPHHIGVYLDIDGGGILHCSNAGVTFDSLFSLKASGWRKMVFYEYARTATDD